jgi:hypothetical protein
VDGPRRGGNSVGIVMPARLGHTEKDTSPCLIRHIQAVAFKKTALQLQLFTNY